MNDDNKLEEIIMYEYRCTPMVRDDNNHELRDMTVVIYAKDHTNAERIFNQQAHKFFDQDLNIVKKQLYKGYRQRQSEKT